MNDALPVIRVVAQIVAGFGVGGVVKNLVANNTSAISTFGTARIWVGSMVLGSMAVDAAMKHVDDQFAQAIEWHEKRKSHLSAVPDVEE